MTLPEAIAKLREARENATAGPWSLDHKGFFVSTPTVDGDWDWIVCAEEDPGDDYTGPSSVQDIYGPRVLSNNAFICLSANTWDALISVVEAAAIHDEHGTAEPRKGCLNDALEWLRRTVEGK